MKKQHLFLAALSVMMLCAAQARSAYMLEIDTDGADDGVLAYHPNFSFGGDTTSASQSAASPAVGLTGGDSIFGGNGAALPDEYLSTYTPATDGDNINLSGQALNDDGDVGLVGTAGGSDDYKIYVTWPVTAGISGGPTKFVLNDGAANVLDVNIDSKTDPSGYLSTIDGQWYTGGEWIYLGTVAMDANTTYTLSQTPTVANSYVSMRAAGYLFETGVEIPEPTTLALLGLGGLGLVLAGRRRS